MVAFVWELTKETIVLPLGCLQGGSLPPPHQQLTSEPATHIHKQTLSLVVSHFLQAGAYLPHRILPLPQSIWADVPTREQTALAQLWETPFATRTTMLWNAADDSQVHDPPWSRVEGNSYVNLPQMPPLRGGICMGVD